MSQLTNLERWDDFLDNASVGLHCVDGKGIVLWVNQTELDFLGYAAEDYLGRFIGDFHVYEPVICDMLEKLTANQTLNAYPARLRAKDGTIKFVMINSNVYQQNGEFRHTRCFTTSLNETTWKILRHQLVAEGQRLPAIAD